MVAVTEPDDGVGLDTPAGWSTARVEVHDGRARAVTLRNVPAFVLRTGARSTSPGLGRVEYDMAFGGNFYALVPAASVGVASVPEQAARADRGRRCRSWTRSTRADRPVHPEDDRIAGCHHVVLHEPGRDGADARAATSIHRGGSTARRADRDQRSAGPAARGGPAGHRQPSSTSR